MKLFWNQKFTHSNLFIYLLIQIKLNKNMFTIWISLLPLNKKTFVIKSRALIHSILITYTIIHSGPYERGNLKWFPWDWKFLKKSKSRSPEKVELVRVQWDKNVVTCHMKYLMKVEMQKSTSRETLFSLQSI